MCIRDRDKASRLADRLVPYTLGGTALTYLLTRNTMKALAVLMVDFSCALKLSMPIAVLSAMRESQNYHISVKGGRFMEAVANADTVVFDKTGTMTYATPTVAKVVAFDGYSASEMLRLAACLEEHFPHSMANAVVEEAKRRGLANLRDTVDCMPAYIDKKNVDLFTKHAILTETEMRARYEIHLENYCKVSAIEASTLLDMVQRHILPAASAYADRLTQTVFHKENSVPALSARMEKTLAQRVTDLGEKLFDTCEALHAALSDAPAADGGIDAARYYRCEIVTRTQKAGELIGRLESLVDAKAWPYPTYADILFSV